MKRSTFITRKMCRRLNACAFTIEITKDHPLLGGYKQDINLLFKEDDIDDWYDNHLTARLELPAPVLPEQVIIHNYLPEINIEASFHTFINKNTTIYFDIEREEKK